MQKVTKSVPASASAATVYIPVLEDNTVIGGCVTCNGVTLDEISTVNVQSGSTVLGTATFPDNSAAGTTVAIVMSPTLATRKTLVTPAIPIGIVTGGEQTTVSGFDVTLRLDDSCTPRD